MSSIVLGIGASHSTLMNTHWSEVDHLPGPHEFRDGLVAARKALEAARPDAVVVIGSNHFRGMFLDLMPTWTVGVSEVQAAGEAQTPSGALSVDTDLARVAVEGLSAADFDPAFSLRLTVDHGITHSLQYLVPELDVPIVPIVVNMFAPPLPSLRRSHDMGRALGQAIRNDGAGKRIAIIASGGLSHRLPWPKWFRTLSDDDRFLVEAWLNGRHSWHEYEVRRRQIIRAAEPDINEEFDRWLLDLFARGDLEPLLDYGDDRLEAEAGNGAHEIRSWLAMRAAVGPATGRTLAYAAIPEWLTGMGVAVFDPQLEEAL
ncbi:2,3-dihydroxyphenylpropionate 1,2-dioxygenase [Spinactinospora alkalitolerans]|uniref:2,3-dihydroxyphenylpropionate 1,2-dioxygenase n=1 Tax=Spinactinospora alkalitolerans TaxID=687207 RepID=A0A852TRY6_9ACTN|nr:MEMO1 family protein [Spinactinospora alkalitolerans]NYE47156.1 2,3-dihydroxyphenylpropionate 1,2-dioxygenase [Spinactinospora alkalitolerans]